MAKSRKSKKSQPAEDIQIPEDEQWRLVRDSGILKSIPTPAKGPDVLQEGAEGGGEDDVEGGLAMEIMTSATLIIPFCFLLLMFEVMAYQQYHRPPTFQEIFDKMISGVPILSLFIFYTNRHKYNLYVQTFLFGLSVACGTRMIYVVNRANWLVVIQQCPRLATLWVYTIVQLNLVAAVAGLVVVYAWMSWKGYRIIFN